MQSLASTLDGNHTLVQSSHPLFFGRLFANKIKLRLIIKQRTKGIALNFILKERFSLAASLAAAMHHWEIRAGGIKGSQLTDRGSWQDDLGTRPN